MARVLVWVSIALGVWAQDEKSTKLVGCLALSRHVILEQAESLSVLVESSPFDQELVLTKLMTTMVTRCLHKISPSTALEVLKAAQSGSSLDSFAALVPVPKVSYKTESQLKLTSEEQEVYQHMLDIQEQAEKVDRPTGGSSARDPDVPFIGTQAGIVTILVLFALVAGLIVYLLKAMQDPEEQSKED